MWALAVTRPRAELVVSDRLRRQDLEHCVFRQRVSHISRGRRIERLVPAFPRYIFVRVCDRIWRYVLELRDRNGIDLVHDFVRMSDNLPVIVAPEVVDHLRATATDDILPIEVSQARFKFGDRVRISAGRSVTTGSEAIYQYTARPGRVCVLLPWLGRLVSTEVDDNEIEPIFKPNRERRHRRRRGGQRHYRRQRGGTAGRPVETASP